MNLEIAKDALRRRAIVFDAGDLHPPDAPFASWSGRLNFAAEDEDWPAMDDCPLDAFLKWLVGTSIIERVAIGWKGHVIGLA